MNSDCGMGFQEGFMEDRLLELRLEGEVDVGRGQRRTFPGEARLGGSGRWGLWKDGVERAIRRQVVRLEQRAQSRGGQLWRQ